MNMQRNFCDHACVVNPTVQVHNTVVERVYIKQRFLMTFVSAFQIHSGKALGDFISCDGVMLGLVSRRQTYGGPINAQLLSILVPSVLTTVLEHCMEMSNIGR